MHYICCITYDEYCITYSKLYYNYVSYVIHIELETHNIVLQFNIICDTINCSTVQVILSFLSFGGSKS